jgi:chemotaxis protein CheZ
MTNQISLQKEDSMIIELRECASLLLEKLQGDDYQEASKMIVNLNETRDRSIFQSVGELTRALHESIKNFNIPGGEQAFSQQGPGEEKGSELNEASSGLEYVLTLTKNAADKTMDMVEECAPICNELGQEANSLKLEWTKLRNREMSPDEFRALYTRLDNYFETLDAGTNKLNENMQNIILEQGFQDLTGQVLKKVINLVTEVEGNLVSLMRIAGQVEAVVGIDVTKYENKGSGDENSEADTAGEGPQYNAEKRTDVVDSQDDVDDLLSSLGF